MPVVVVDLDDGRGPRPPEEVLTDGPSDLPYFVETARAAARLTDQVDRFVISYSPTVGPLLTERDVWLLVGDEKATPLPRNPVCPVLRTYGERFAIPARGLSGDPLLSAAEVALWARNAMRAMWLNWPYIVPRSGRRQPGWLPLGIPAFRSVPESVPPIQERPIDVGFRGSVRGGKRYSPKTISRQRMVSALGGMSPGTVVDFEETQSFVDSYARDPESYARSLLETKICLAPRGGSVETFRVFEGALAGCVLITEPLPSAWFYAGLPRIELRSWSQLPRAVDELRASPALMDLMSAGARRWALDVASPKAVGDWIAGWLRNQHR